MSMRFLSRGFFSTTIALFPGVLFAGEYIPPPTGPYQSSVIISDKNLFQPNNGNHQVYRFPTDELIQQDVSPMTFSRDNRISSPKNRQAPSVAQTPAANQVERPVIPQAASPSPNVYPANPWAPNAQGPVQQPMQQQYPNQNVWGTQPYRQQQYMQQQYPYGYTNPNSYMNAPFYGMPSPWSGMPMQPFFSGR